MDEINFSENYNYKLNCTYYTTIRKKSEKYKIGNVYNINLHNIFLHKSLLIGIKYIDLSLRDNNDFYIELDTGLNYDDSRKLFKELEINGMCMLLLLRKINE